MGKRGPKPTPLALLAQRGSWLAAARAKDGRPVLEVSTPAKPAHLDAAAGARWDQMIEHLSAIGVLSMVDGPLIERYCMTTILWLETHALLRQRGKTTYAVLDDAGMVREIKAYPEVAMLVKLGDQLLRMEDRMGLSPSARCSLRTAKVLDAQPAEQPQDKSRFFS